MYVASFLAPPRKNDFPRDPGNEASYIQCTCTIVADPEKKEGGVGGGGGAHSMQAYMERARMEIIES